MLFFFLVLILIICVITIITLKVLTWMGAMFGVIDPVSLIGNANQYTKQCRCMAKEIEEHNQTLIQRLCQRTPIPPISVQIDVVCDPNTGKGYIGILYTLIDEEYNKPHLLWGIKNFQSVQDDEKKMDEDTIKHDVTNTNIHEALKELSIHPTLDDDDDENKTNTFDDLPEKVCDEFFALIDQQLADVKLESQEYEFERGGEILKFKITKKNNQAYRKWLLVSCKNHHFTPWHVHKDNHKKYFPIMITSDAGK